MKQLEPEIWRRRSMWSELVLETLTPAVQVLWWPWRWSDIDLLPRLSSSPGTPCRPGTMLGKWIGRTRRRRICWKISTSAQLSRGHLLFFIATFFLQILLDILLAKLVGHFRVDKLERHPWKPSQSRAGMISFYQELSIFMHQMKLQSVRRCTHCNGFGRWSPQGICSYSLVGSS